MSRVKSQESRAKGNSFLSHFPAYTAINYGSWFRVHGEW